MDTATEKTFVQVEYPLAEAKTIEDLRQYRWPDPDWFDYSELCGRLIRRMVGFFYSLQRLFCISTPYLPPEHR